MAPRASTDIHFGFRHHNPTDGKTAFDNLFPYDHKPMATWISSLAYIHNPLLSAAFKPASRGPTRALSPLFVLADTHDSLPESGLARALAAPAKTPASRSLTHASSIHSF